MASQKVNVVQVEKASNALKKHIEISKKKKATEDAITPIFDEDETISLIITLRRVPERRNDKGHRIEIPHSLRSAAETDICLITKDPHSEYKKMVEESKAKVAKVLGLTKLRTDFKVFEAKRKLLASYDMFMADSAIIPLLPQMLGKSFFKSKKQPIPISITSAQSLAKEVAKARDSTYLYFSQGSCVNVNIAKSSFTADQIKENIIEGLNKIVPLIPKKWSNIQSIHIKTSTSVALPIYSSLPQTAVIASTATNNTQSKKRKIDDEEEDEIDSEEVEENGKEEVDEDDEEEEEEEEEEVPVKPAPVAAKKNARKGKTAAVPTTKQPVAKPSPAKKTAAAVSQKEKPTPTPTPVVPQKKAAAKEQTPQKKVVAEQPAKKAKVDTKPSPAKSPATKKPIKKQKQRA